MRGMAQRICLSRINRIFYGGSQMKKFNFFITLILIASLSNNALEAAQGNKKDRRRKQHETGEAKKPVQIKEQAKKRQKMESVDSSGAGSDTNEDTSMIVSSQLPQADSDDKPELDLSMQLKQEKARFEEALEQELFEQELAESMLNIDLNSSSSSPLRSGSSGGQASTSSPNSSSSSSSSQKK